MLPKSNLYFEITDPAAQPATPMRCNPRFVQWAGHRKQRSRKIFLSRGSGHNQNDGSMHSHFCSSHIPACPKVFIKYMLLHDHFGFVDSLSAAPPLTTRLKWNRAQSSRLQSNQDRRGLDTDN